MTTTPYVARRSETTEFTGYTHPYLDSRKIGQLIVNFLLSGDGVRIQSYTWHKAGQDMPGSSGCAVFLWGPKCQNQSPQGGEAR